MIQKHRISTNIGKDQVVKVELKQDFDLLEILSLKFTQKEIYTSLCADYGVVCGRVSVNNGFGVPNARVSIFIPLSSEDETDPVISALYPYKEIGDQNADGYRYNLLPSRKQHSGHSPTGTFPDQRDILTREEVLEVYEKYYKYTVKTNDAGDFMIWGVGLGEQRIHVDVDLSDMGCQSLAPYDLMYEGVSVEKFQNQYTYMASNNLESLPQIVSFDKTIEVYPFWGNEDLCEIGLTRTDFDLKDRGIRIEPYSIVMGGTFTDSGKDALRVRCNVDNQQGEKCRLTTMKGDIEAIRFTGEFEKDSNGDPDYNRPILEKIEIDQTIDEFGRFFFRVPMNTNYITTNEFGEIVESKNKNIGIPTESTYRFRFSLSEDTGERNRFTGKILVPNVREYHTGDTSYNGSYGTINPNSYSFSTTITDYPSAAIDEILGKSADAIADGKRGIPQDYFYKFRYGRTYTVGQFINRYYNDGSLGKLFSFFKRDRRESFIGIKEIWPDESSDCSSTINYFPINDAVRNHRFNFFILTMLSYVDWIGFRTQLFFKELNCLIQFGAAGVFGIFNKSASAKQFARAKETQFKSIFKLNLITYPDCYDCEEDNSENEITINAEAINVAAVTGGTQGVNFISTTSSPFSMGERYSTASVNCSKYDLTNTGTTAQTVTYTDCDNVSQTSTVQPGSSVSLCVKNGTTPTIPSGLSSVFTADGCSGAAAFQPNESLYFYPTVNTQPGYTITNIPTYNSSPKDGDYLYQRYVMEIDVLGGASEYITVGVGQSYPIMYDGPTNRWKIKDAYKTIADTIASAYNLPYDQPVLTSAHPEQGRVVIKKLWYVDNVPISATTINEDEEGCAKYDFIIEDSKTRTGNMNLQGLKLPLTGATAVYETYSEAFNAMNGTRAPRNTFYGSPPFYDQLDANYNTTILAASVPDCETPPEYNIGAVASVHAKWPTQDRRDFRNGDSRCVYRGEYAGQVKKKGPYFVDEFLTRDGTLSGWSEFRDGVYTIVPLAGRTGELINSYRRRKLFGKLMCGGVVSYTFSNSWLNGALYFFQFMKRGTNRFCKDCLYRKVESDGNVNYYYRSTPYNPSYSGYEAQYNGNLTNDEGKTYNQVYSGKTKGFYGSRRLGTNRREINFPTTIIDLGPRTTWIDEVCVDPALDVNCSITRSIGATSFKQIDDLMEYVIQSKELKERGRLDIQDLFDSRGDGLIDGDIAQLLNFNTQTGIYPFEYEELDSPYSSLYNGYFDNKGPVGIDLVYSEDNPDTLIVEANGLLIRKCINEKGRLGDYSQKVPYYMWDTKGHGFGENANGGESQNYYVDRIYNQRIQEIKSNLNTDATVATLDDFYLSPEASYVLPPIRDCVDNGSGKQKSNDNYKEYTVGGNIKHLMEIGSPFHFMFGLKKGNTAWDKFIESFGPK
jgi:hypothetical protein